MNPRALVLAAAGLGAAAAGCDEDAINPMAARQPRVNYYGASDFYPDGMGMRQPPAGTVPRQRTTGNPKLTTGKDGDNYVTTFPVKVDEPLLKLGQKRYDITCGTCHGPLGDGDSIVGKHMALKPPPALMDFADRPVGYIFEVASKGHGLMASYEAELTLQERWAIVAYVRALQVARTATLAKAPPAEQARLQAEPATPSKEAP
jgi:mono/diheme cytochrome c family protein